MAKTEQDVLRIELTTQAAVAWEVYQGAGSEVVAREAQLEAARLGLDGVKKEYEVGTRVFLDVLNAEQELFEASTALKDAQYQQTLAVLRLEALQARLAHPR